MSSAALGLGHSPDPASPMYESLAAGVADRTPTTQDLNIPDPPDGADPQMAADVHHILPAAHPVPATPPSNTEPIGMMPLGAGTAGHDAVLNRWHSPHRAATRSDRVPASGRSSIGHHARQVGQPSAPLPRHRLVDRAIEVIGALRPVPDLDATGPAAQPPRVRLM